MKNLILLMVITMSVSVSQAKNNLRIVAHRGYWNTENSVENSISSLRNAAGIGVFGSELDIMITKDNVPVVHHNAKTAKGDVIENSTLEQVRQSVLSNSEQIPTLEEYLEAGKSLKKLCLILEIKPHSTAEREAMVVQKTLELVKKMKLEKRVEYITFSMNIGKELIRLSPKAKVAYLGGEVSPTELKKIGYTGLDYYLPTMKKNESWFAEAAAQGLTVNVWTVNSEEDMRYAIEKGADYITTDNPTLLQKITE